MTTNDNDIHPMIVCSEEYLTNEKKYEEDDFYFLFYSNSNSNVSYFLWINVLVLFHIEIEMMDQFYLDRPSDAENQENIFLEMMKQHISNGMNFPTSSNHLIEGSIQGNSDGETSSHVEPDFDDNDSLVTPIVYKKRARIKFSQEQLDILESTFQQHRYPTIDMIDDLVEQLNLPTQKITVWFQNRRARLKKSQQKLDEQISIERDDQQKQCDSGIHLDDDLSRASSTSPPCYNYSSVNYLPNVHSTTPHYYHSFHQPFYEPMWQNFRHSMTSNSFPTNFSSAPNLPYHLMNYNSPFAFQDMNNYSTGTDFYG